MGSIKGVSVVLGIFLASHAFGDDRPVSPRKTLEEIKAELKPLRERAALEPEVVAARKSLDEAYRAYWESVRVAEIRLRKQLNSVRGEASPSPTPAGSKP
jgi:hypothetical protein